MLVFSEEAFGVVHGPDAVEGEEEPPSLDPLWLWYSERWFFFDSSSEEEGVERYLHLKRGIDHTRCEDTQDGVDTPWCEPAIRIRASKHLEGG